MSIQAFIFCSDPYFNEPGYQNLYGNPKYEAYAHRMNESLFASNLNVAIVGQIRNPPEGFEDVRPLKPEELWCTGSLIVVSVLEKGIRANVITKNSTLPGIRLAWKCLVTF